MAPTTCDLCEANLADGSLTFLDVSEQGVVATLNLRLCSRCGARLEKHLKRAIPRRLFQYYRGASRMQPRTAPDVIPPPIPGP